MAPKKKGVSFLKVDKVAADSTAKGKKTVAAVAVAAAPAPAAPAKAKQAKKETSKLNRLAPAAALAGKKQTPKTAIAAASTGTVVASASTTPAAALAATKKPRLSKKDKKKCAPYVALQLRNLPDAFQEPQIRKFFCQFGVPIAQACVQRTKKRATSRGLAYVRFAPKDDAQEKLMDVILDECRAMNLGGKTVTAKWVTMSRMLPSRKSTDARRQVEYKNKTEGVALERHNVLHFDWVNRLRNSAKTEASGNKFLKTIGIEYEFKGFATQVPLVPENAKAASKTAQNTVKLVRIATAIGRRKGFNNDKMLRKVLDKKRAKRKASRQRKADKKKAAKTSAGEVATSTTTATTKRAVVVGKKK